MEFNVFESIKIGLASPEKIREWSYGEVKKPHPEARTRWSVLRAYLWSYQGLGVLLRQV